MSNTESDTDQNTVDSHKTAVREYLRTHGALAKPPHLIVPTERAGTAA